LKHFIYQYNIRIWVDKNPVFIPMRQIAMHRKKAKQRPVNSAFSHYPCQVAKTAGPGPAKNVRPVSHRRTGGPLFSM